MVQSCLNTPQVRDFKSTKLGVYHKQFVVDSRSSHYLTCMSKSQMRKAGTQIKLCSKVGKYPGQKTTELMYTGRQET